MSMRAITVLLLLVLSSGTSSGQPCEGDHDAEKAVLGGSWWRVTGERNRPRRRLEPAPTRERGVVPSSIVDLPGPDLLGEGEVEMDLRLLVRWTGSGVFSDLRSATATAQEATCRFGFAPGLELSVGGDLEQVDGSATVAGTLSDWSARMVAVTGTAKFGLPDRILGNRIVFGAGGSLLSEGSRERFQPNDFTRLAPLYVLVSRELADRCRAELVFRRGRILSTALNPGTNLTAFCLGVELRPPGLSELQLEIIRQVVSTRPVGAYGLTLDLDGINVNVGLRRPVGPSGSIQLYGQHLNRKETLELGLWYGHRL